MPSVALAVAIALLPYGGPAATHVSELADLQTDIAIQRRFLDAFPNSTTPDQRLQSGRVLDQLEIRGQNNALGAQRDLREFERRLYGPPTNGEISRNFQANAGPTLAIPAAPRPEAALPALNAETGQETQANLERLMRQSTSGAKRQTSHKTSPSHHDK